MDKLKLAHDYLLKIMSNSPLVDQVDIEFAVSTAWSYARMMHSEKIKEDKIDSEQKRKEIREMLNAPNTFVEREGQHFDDVEEWQPDWSQAPDDAKYWAMDKDHTANFFKNKPEITTGNGWDFGGVMQSNNSHSYQGNWQDSLRERPNGF